MSTGKTTHKILFALGLTLGLASTAAVAQSTSQLELKAYLNEPGGPEIMEGLYADAEELIETKLSSLKSLDALVAYNNLCVARTMLGEFETAELACNAAVRRAKEMERRTRSRSDRPSATALNNRAVLSIVQGDFERAIADLERASPLERSDRMAQARNLAYIGQLSTQSFAEAE